MINLTKTDSVKINAITMQNISFEYNKDNKILDNVNFQADFGEFVLISGMSGKGKSTLTAIMSGIIPNSIKGNLQGEVLIEGQSILGHSLGAICRKVGIVLQNAEQQIINRVVSDEIAFGCENLAFDRSAIDDQIKTVCQLLDLNETDNTHTLSGGQKQRLITASTLAMGQRIVILDEPLANLDKENAHKLLTLLRQLANQGYCIIIVEHRLDMVLPFVDRVWHLENGQISVIEDYRQYLEYHSTKIADSCELYQDKEILFSLKDVTYSVKNKQILKGIDCDIPKGSRVVLMGENGCGKTTLMRLLARLQKPTTGKITTESKDKLFIKNKANKHWFKKVGIVYQNPDYQLFMPTVFKEIEFGATSKQYAMEVAELFRLTHLLDRHPHSLSQGQKRRLSIACVVATQPEVLLLDEPTVGQDYEGLKRLVDIINNLHKKTGNTVITVTHDVRCAEALCDKAYIMDSGKIIAHGGKQLVNEYFSKCHEHCINSCVAK